MMIGVVAIYLNRPALSTFSMVGIVMLAGIVVNNGIVLVDYTNLLSAGAWESGKPAPRRERPGSGRSS
jgi:HAE1 family hydrophobic/amphiphilic exporter-1